MDLSGRRSTRVNTGCIWVLNQDKLKSERIGFHEIVSLHRHSVQQEVGTHCIVTEAIECIPMLFISSKWLHRTAEITKLFTSVGGE